MKIAIIGAGGYVFPLRLIGDIFSFPALQDCTLALMDIDQERLGRTANAARELVAHHGLTSSIEATTDRRRAVEGADVVILTFQVGGPDAFKLDVEIPRKYGIDQTVGDTLGPGGVFRFLRLAPVYREIAVDMADLCPDALLINYVNPMAMSCWFLDLLGVKTVGLCHSVQGTSRMLARQLDVPYDDVTFRAAGINHQAWFPEFRRGDENLYPRLREVMARRHLGRTPAASMATDHGDHSDADRGDSNYEGGAERVRTAIMDSFGYFHTESSHHASEYLPYFRKDREMIEEIVPERWDYYQICLAHDADEQTANMLERLKGELTPSVEYGAAVINAMATGEPAVIYGNVSNEELIPNLPHGCSVEVACLVDANGIQPTAAGPLPAQCAAVHRTNINVQALAVAAAWEEDASHIEHAVALDPLTGALLTLDDIRAMVGEMIAAEAKWLPAFAVERRSSPNA
ncbi:MAG: alpha-galactosidase [Thermomicrobiales bacterium]